MAEEQKLDELPASELDDLDFTNLDIDMPEEGLEHPDAGDFSGPLDPELDLKSDELLDDDFLAADDAPMTMHAPAALHEEEGAADLDANPVNLDEEDLEPISLSDSELEHILETGDDLASDHPENDDAGGFAELDADHSDFTELDLEEEARGPSFSDDFDLSNPYDSDTSAAPDSDSDFGDFSPDELLPDEPVILEDLPSEPVHDDDDEGPLALSEDELGNILADVDQTALEEPADTPDILAQDSSDDDYTLSDAELAAAVLDEDSRVEVTQAVPSALDDLDDEDEPITLTADELGNIVADLEEEDAPELPAYDAGMEEPALLATETAESSILSQDDDDEGPVALSEDELSLILEDVGDASEEAPGAIPVMDALEEGHDTIPVMDAPEEALDVDDSKNVIVLDEYEELEKEPEAPEEELPSLSEEREAVVASAAAESKLEPADLRKMIGYLDNLFDQLPEATIKEFSRSEYFDLYKKIMTELGL